MLRIWYSPDRLANTDAVISEICGNAKRGVGRQIFIVPEQFSFDAEWHLCVAGDDSISRYAEVLSFSRLADRVFSAEGGAAVKLLDGSGRLLAMAQTLDMLKNKLNFYRHYSSKPEFLTSLVKLYDEFKSCGIDTPGIDRIAGSLEGTLAEKIADIRLIIDCYEGVCAGALQDPTARLDRLAELLERCDYAAGRDIFIDGFFDFTAQEQRVIRLLMRNAARVTVTVLTDELFGGESVFSMTREASGALIGTAAQLGIPRELRALSPETGPLRGVLLGNLFSGKSCPEEPSCGRVYRTACSSAQAECDSAIARVQQLVLSGVRYRQIAICCTDKKTFLPLLEGTAAKYRIPVYHSGGADILSQPVIRMLLSALRAVSGGMEQQDVLDYLKSGFIRISPDECDLLSAYAEVWSLRGNDWEHPFAGNPAGYEDRKTDPEQLKQLNKIRRAALMPLLTLKKSLKAAENIAQKTQALCTFLEDIRLADTLTGMAEEYAAAGDLDAAQSCSRQYDLLLDTLEQMYGAIGKCVYTVAEFVNLLQTALSCCKIGTIPATLDAVRIGAPADLRNSAADYLLMVGASNDLLPPQVRTNSVLSDDDRRKLMRAGLEVLPDAGAGLKRELLCAYSVLTSPEKELWMSCRASEPSFVFTRLGAMFPDSAALPAEPLPVTPEQAAVTLLRLPETVREAACAEYPEVAQAVRVLSGKTGYRPGDLGEKTVSALYGEEIKLDASKLETFADCRFRFFMEAGLSVREPVKAEMNSALFGTVVHYVLEKTVSRVMREGGFRAVAKETALDCAKEYYGQYAEEKLNDFRGRPRRERYLYERNLDEVLFVVSELWEEMTVSAFEPELFEYGFFGEKAVVVHGDRLSCRLSGKVDRVDFYTDGTGNRYLRIIDYKTGSKTFDYKNLARGADLQMPLYLFVLVNHGGEWFRQELKPAGILYFPARLDENAASGNLPPEKVAEKRRQAIRRIGLLPDDPALLRAMDPAPTGKSEFLPYEITKDGEPAGSVISAGQFELLEKYVSKTAADTADAIGTGALTPDPCCDGKRAACDYCPYAAVCHSASHPERLRVVPSVSETEFWNLLESGEKTYG